MTELPAGHEKCFACDAKTKTWRVAFTIDGQTVFVGSSCHKRVMKSGRDGWQPPLGGPRLFGDHRSIK